MKPKTYSKDHKALSDINKAKTIITDIDKGNTQIEFNIFDSQLKSDLIEVLQCFIERKQKEFKDL